MSSNNNKQTVTDAATLIASSGGANEEQNMLATLLRRKLEKEEREEEAAEAQKQSYRKASAEAALQNQREKLNGQERCPHMKQNFQSALAGQRDHKQTLHLFCQTCQKEFIGNDIPYHLQPVMERVGGPQ